MGSQCNIAGFGGSKKPMQMALTEIKDLSSCSVSNVASMVSHCVFFQSVICTYYNGGQVFCGNDDVAAFVVPDNCNTQQDFYIKSLDDYKEWIEKVTVGSAAVLKSNFVACLIISLGFLFNGVKNQF